ncbi:MAG: flagellar hook protein FlgE [Anaeromyxobacter sp.]|nr:flagellar hook protein FlgE [Anaeromyxobacter sp.]MBL0276198.1 flagellar hook protein FlgE [Anaeromyxobacter sp.]
MSLLTSLSAGTTGLEAASLELSVVGDNIANANTIGFKGGRAAFEDALTQTVIGGTGEIGLGARLESVQKILTQGALNSTGIATDLALQGNGFFIVSGNHNGQTANFFTRAGQFTVDKDGFMVNLEGLKVQGFPADAAGALSAQPGNLLVGTASAQPRATGSIQVKANLKADAVIKTDALGAPIPFDPANPGGTSEFSTSMTVYDTLGAAHAVQVFFSKTATGAGGNSWEWNAMTDGGGLAPPAVAGTLEVIAGGALTFDNQGRLATDVPRATNATTFNPLGAAAPQPLTFNFGDPTAVAGNTGLLGVSQFAAPSASTFIGQDGFGSGQLASIRIDPTGNINGVFTNGQTRVLGQVAVAAFSGPDRMERVGGNLFQQSQASGQPVIGAPGAGGRASIISGSLEQSNVDLAEQFVRLIAAQRAFQANSKTITTADQLLSELIALKR